MIGPYGGAGSHTRPSTENDTANAPSRRSHGVVVIATCESGVCAASSIVMVCSLQSLLVPRLFVVQRSYVTYQGTTY